MSGIKNLSKRLSLSFAAPLETTGHNSQKLRSKNGWKSKLANAFRMSVPRTLSCYSSQYRKILEHTGDTVLGMLLSQFDRGDFFLLHSDRKARKLAKKLSLVCKTWKGIVENYFSHIGPVGMLSPMTIGWSGDKRRAKIGSIFYDYERNLVTKTNAIHANTVGATELCNALLGYHDRVRAIKISNSVLSSNSISELVSRTLFLKQLVLEKCVMVGDVEIVSKSIKHLVISNFSGSPNLTIDCPSLETCIVKRSNDQSQLGISMGNGQLENLSIKGGSLRSVTLQYLYTLKCLYIQSDADCTNIEISKRCFMKSESGGAVLSFVCKTYRLSTTTKRFHPVIGPLLLM